MALTDEGLGTTMLVQPTGGMPYGNYGGNGLFGGGDSWLGILFLIALCNGGFGNGFGGFGGNALGYDFPWILNGQNNINSNTNSGFRDAMINDGITSIRDGIGSLSTQMCSGFGNVSTQLCNGFNGVTNSVNNAQNAIAQQLYTNQLADLERSFNAQNASNQNFNSLQSQLAQCCCDNRLATAQTQSLALSENCADRAALSEGIRDILVNNTTNTQRILDQMCNDKIDAKNERIADLERQLTMANLAASQTAQTARLLSDNAAQTAALENYLNPPARPAYIVQNPNCCANYTVTPTCGCNSGCGGF